MIRCAIQGCRNEGVEKLVIELNPGDILDDFPLEGLILARGLICRRHAMAMERVAQEPTLS